MGSGRRRGVAATSRFGCRPRSPSAPRRRRDHPLRVCRSRLGHRLWSPSPPRRRRDPRRTALVALVIPRLASDAGSGRRRGAATPPPLRRSGTSSSRWGRSTRSTRTSCPRSSASCGCGSRRRTSTASARAWRSRRSSRSTCSGRGTRGRVDVVSAGPGVAMYFKKTAPAFQRCKNEQERSSHGRDQVALAGTWSTTSPKNRKTTTSGRTPPTTGARPRRRNRRRPRTRRSRAKRRRSRASASEATRRGRSPRRTQTRRRRATQGRRSLRRRRRPPRRWSENNSLCELSYYWESRRLLADFRGTRGRDCKRSYLRVPDEPALGLHMIQMVCVN